MVRHSAAFALSMSLLLASGTWSSVRAQEWAARFPRHPDCAVQLTPGPAPDSPGTATLIVRTVAFGTDDPISGIVVVIAPTSGQDTSIKGVPPTDLTGIRVISGLVPGSYGLRTGGVGYWTRTDTVTVAAGSADTLRLPIATWNEEYRNEHNCRPRRFRQSGESACLADDELVAIHMDYARRLNTPGERAAMKLPRGDSSKVEHVRDEKTCEKAARLYGRAGDPPRRIIVIRMDNLYLVFDPYEPIYGGEFDLHKIFDRGWRELVALEG